MRQEIFVLIVHLYTTFSSGTKTWYKGHSSSFLYSFSPTLEQSHTPLKEKKSREERKSNSFRNKFS